MVIKRVESSKIGFSGTIIDLETVGEFDHSYRNWETKHYADHRPIILGYLTDDTLMQFCAEGVEDIPRLLRVINSTLPKLEEPFYALNCNFEFGVLTCCNCFVPTIFYDVRGSMFEGSKWSIRQRLSLPTYEDPFDGDGSRCKIEWPRGKYEDCIKHNRACLLIERDIQEYIMGIYRRSVC